MSGVKGLSGRKPKSVEIELIEKLQPLEPKAFELLKEGLDSGDFKYLRLYFLYRYGKPREQKPRATIIQYCIQVNRRYGITYHNKRTECGLC